MEGLGINWKILSGQIVNFIILFFLLRRFAYKPFLKTLRQRRELIQETAKKSEEAEKSLVQIRELSSKIEEEGQKKARETIMSAEFRAQARAKEILTLAETEKQKTIEVGRLAVQKERQSEQERLQRESVDKAFLLAEKILQEKIDQKRDKKFIQENITNLI